MLSILTRKRVIYRFILSKCYTPFHVTTEFQRKMSSLSNTVWKYAYVASPDKPIYLKVIENSTENESESCDLNFSENGENETGHLLMFPKCTASSNSITATCSYVKSAILSMPIYRNPEFWSKGLLAHCLQFGFTNGHEETSLHLSVKRGVYINANIDSIKPLTDNFTLDFDVYFLSKHQGNTYKLLRHTDNNETENAIILQLVQGSKTCANQSEGNVSPIFRNPDLRPVFHNYQRTIDILKQISDKDEVKELLAIADHITMPPDQLCTQALKHPFIVVEGMDATGKTTLTEHLQSKLKAVRYYTPPPQLTKLRPVFDAYPEIVRRAYYSLGNYMVAEEIVQECQNRPVIMDRYWHSTAAYGIANETSSGDLPAVGHPVYDFPTDLLQPTLVLFLTVKEEVRKQRLRDRGVQATFEEKSLDRDQLFRQRLCDSYRRMQNPSLVEIDAGGTVEEVQALAIDVLQQNHITV